VCPRIFWSLLAYSIGLVHCFYVLHYPKLLPKQHASEFHDQSTNVESVRACVRVCAWARVCLCVWRVVRATSWNWFGDWMRTGTKLAPVHDRELFRSSTLKQRANQKRRTWHRCLLEHRLQYSVCPFATCRLHKRAVEIRSAIGVAIWAFVEIF